MSKLIIKAKNSAYLLIPKNLYPNKIQTKASFAKRFLKAAK
jgi:hypothetical protein